MKFTKFTLAFATLALGAAFAASDNYHVTLTDPTWVGTTQLKPGDYKVNVEGNKAVLKSGKNSVEVPVKVEQADHKYSTSQVLTRSENNKSQLQELRIGGSTTRIIIQSATPTGQ